jgi:hypothetical protein
MLYPESDSIVNQHPEISEHIRDLDDFLAHFQGPHFSVEHVSGLLRIETGLLTRLLRCYEEHTVVERIDIEVCPYDQEELQVDDDGALWCDICERSYYPEECEKRMAFRLLNPLRLPREQDILQQDALPSIQQHVTIERAEFHDTNVENLEVRNMTQNTIKLENTTILGNFTANQAELIQDSFNTAGNADIQPELRELLKSLSEQVARMVADMPPDQAQDVIDNLSTLVREAVKPKPRREWWSLSVEGLTKAAQNIGDIGKPVLETAGRIVSLLAPLVS